MIADEGPIRKSGKGIPGQYIVALNDRDGRNAAGHANALANAYGGRVLAVYDAVLPGFAIELPEAAAEGLARNPKVRYVEENLVVRASQGQTSTNYQDTSVAADSSYGLWHLDRVDQRQIYDRSLDGEYAWCNGGLNVRAYVVDTGIRADHAEFEGRVTQGYEATGDPVLNIPPADGTPTDPCIPNRSQLDGQGYHGTAVASILGGKNLGVAKNVTLVPVRVLRCDASGDLKDILEGLNWIMSDPDRGSGPAVINMSFWVEGEAQPPSLRDVLNNLEAAGFAIFVSANNWNENACNKAPASFARGNSGAVVSVGGTQVGPNGDGLSSYDLRDYRWDDSSFGNCVDIWAPAHGMRSADYHTPDGTTTGRSGTSFSSPIVAGIAARWLQAHPVNLQTGQPTTPAEVWAWLDANATTEMSAGTPLIQDVQTTPHTRMVFFDEGCRSHPVTPGCVPLSISKQPDSWKLTNTSQVTLGVNVNASSPAFQWFRGVRGDVSQPIAGAVYSTYTIEPVNNQSSSYWVRVSDTCNNVLYSETATITYVVFCPAIDIDAQPTPSTSVTEGSSVTLSVVARSENPLSYQWEWRSSPYLPWNPLYSATNPSLSVTPAQSTFYRVRVWNGCTERYSSVAWVNVQPAPRDYAVTFRTYYWNYVSADGGGGAGVNANAGAAWEWERFVLRDLNGGDLVDGDLVTLRTYNGHYVVAEWCGGPGQTVNADRTSAGDWETFQIRNMDGGYWIMNGNHVALKACSGGGYYVVAEYGGLNGGGPGAGEVNCDRTDAGPWETFEMLSQ